jgi:hypothetical protein
MNPPTQYLLRLFGPLLLIIGIGIVLNPKQYMTMMKSLKPDSLSWYLMAIASLTIGIVMVQAHNAWNTFDQFLVSLMGWAALAKGVVRTMKPDFSMKVISNFAKPKNLTPAAWVIVILGGYMCYAGFIA